MSPSEETELNSLELAAIESLESLAFTEAAPCPFPEGFPESGKGFAAEIALDKGGLLAIWMEKGLLRGLAGTLFSLPPDELPDDVLSDALKEFLNILAGRYMASDKRVDRVLSLGLPVEVEPGTLGSGFPIRFCLKAEPSGYFSLGLKP